jgi:hypothetical protein
MLPTAYTNTNYMPPSNPMGANMATAMPYPTMLAQAPMPARYGQQPVAPYALPFFPRQGLQAQYGNQPLLYSQPEPFMAPSNQKQLSQFTQSGINRIQSKQYNRSVAVNQQANAGQAQQVYFGAVQGDVNISQQGRTISGNQAIFNNVAGNALLNSFNRQGDVYIKGSAIDGLVDINAGTDGIGLTEVELTNLRRGGLIRSVGSSDIQVGQSRDAVTVENRGNARQQENFRISLTDTQGARMNQINLSGQQEDSASIDLTGNKNASIVYLKGLINNIQIQGKNQQTDVFHVEGDAVIDLATLDAEDTVVTHLADGSTIAKSVLDLQYLKTLRTMTPRDAAEILRANFGAFESLMDKDPNRKDGIAQFSELVTYTKLPNADPKIKAAAQFFIDNKANTYDIAEAINAEGRKDNALSTDDLARFIRVYDGAEPMPAFKTDAQLAQEDAIKNMNGKTAAQILTANFGAFEGLMDGDKSRRDGIAQFGELVAYTQLATTDPMIKAAAQYFIDHRTETFDIMEGLNVGGAKDGIFSLDEMTKFAARG